MKKSRIVFINRSRLNLHIECKNCGVSDLNYFAVKRKAAIKLIPGRYHLKLYYDCSNIEITSNLNGLLEVGDIAAPCNEKFKGKMIVLNHSAKKVRIVCNNKISIAGLVEGL